MGIIGVKAEVGICVWEIFGSYRSSCEGFGGFVYFIGLSGKVLEFFVKVFIFRLSNGRVFYSR